MEHNRTSVLVFYRSMFTFIYFCAVVIKCVQGGEAERYLLRSRLKPITVIRVSEERKKVKKKGRVEAKETLLFSFFFVMAKNVFLFKELSSSLPVIDFYF